MSVPVALAALAERVEEFGTIAYLVTVGSEGLPHVVSVRVAWDGPDLVVGAGRQTLTNVSARAGFSHPSVYRCYRSNHDGTFSDVSVRAGVAVLAPL